jgi:L,D-transpeptidase catalytic domain
MKKHFGGLFCLLLVFSITMISWKPADAVKAKHKLTKISKINKPVAARQLFEKYIDNVYETAGLEASGLSYNIFKKALIGFINLKNSDKLSQTSSMLTVIDFSKSSCQKRMWIIDVLNKSIVLHTWVAHGENSGDDIPKKFSDRVDSKQSSLGFYLTNDVYFGDHGRSLKLDGLDEGFNANARKRAIVIHAADYVCENLINLKGRLGRSFGCPAVSPEVIDRVIDNIKDKTVLFISGKSKRYNSKYLNEDAAAGYLASTDLGSNETASL